ncbi:MAG: thioredoxin domain-containing protein [Elusimicrobia bacterium]|nr:thioredoxin domain-containing protein [Elusimicrobiota bacterium]
MLESRSNRALGSALLILGLTAAVTALGSLLRPTWQPQAPAYRVRGPQDAKVVIAEFSDFECPACAAAEPYIRKILDLYSGKVSLAFKHRAWDFHPYARLAADAAECAGRSGKFWDYHDRLFAQQDKWANLPDAKAVRGYLLEQAAQMGMDKKAFDACLDDPKTDAPVAADVKEAEKMWVEATPTFVIGGRRFVGGDQLRTLGVNRIEDLLKRP